MMEDGGVRLVSFGDNFESFLYFTSLAEFGITSLRRITLLFL